MNYFNTLPSRILSFAQISRAAQATQVALIACCVLVTSSPVETLANEKRPKLTIGSRAPKIEIENWLSLPNDFEEVNRFKKGNVYVVEFWATWCPPCRRAIPHLSEVQQEFADQGVQVIGVSSEPLETVQKFLKSKPKKDQPESFIDFTSKYCLTCDPDGSVKKDMFRAAGQSGIPCTFLIGKTGYVEWIGSPTRVDGPLKQVLDDSWDRAAFKESFERKYRLKKGKKEISKLLQDEDFDKAVQQMGRLAKDCEGKELQTWQLKQIEVGLEHNLSRAERDFKRIAGEHYKDPVMMNQMAWAVVAAHESGVEIEPRVLELARTAIDLSVKDAPTAASLDTLAHVAELQGKIEEAVEHQTRAVEMADEKLKPTLEAYLQQLKSR